MPKEEVIEIHIPEYQRRRIRRRAPTTPEGQAKRLANLTPYKKGQSGNPSGLKGKSKTQLLATLVRQIGSEEIDEQTGWTRIDAVIRALYQEAIKGKTQAAQLLFERGWGKVPQAIDIDVKTEVTDILSGLNMSLEEAARDPLMRELLESAGFQLEEVKETDGPEPISGLITEGESGADTEESGATGDS